LYNDFFVKTLHYTEMSSVAPVQYQAAATLKEAVIREWHVIDKQTRGNLQQFIMDFLTKQPR